MREATATLHACAVPFFCSNFAAGPCCAGGRSTSRRGRCASMVRCCISPLNRPTAVAAGPAACFFCVEVGLGPVVGKATHPAAAGHCNHRSSPAPSAPAFSCLRRVAVQDLLPSRDVGATHAGGCACLFPGCIAQRPCVQRRFCSRGCERLTLSCPAYHLPQQVSLGGARLDCPAAAATAAAAAGASGAG